MSAIPCLFRSAANSLEASAIASYGKSSLCPSQSISPRSSTQSHGLALTSVGPYSVILSKYQPKRPYRGDRAGRSGVALADAIAESLRPNTAPLTTRAEVTARAGRWRWHTPWCAHSLWCLCRHVHGPDVRAGTTRPRLHPRLRLRLCLIERLRLPRGYLALWRSRGDLAAIALKRYRSNPPMHARSTET
jgi:hypothetical protein